MDPNEEANKHVLWHIQRNPSTTIAQTTAPVSQYRPLLVRSQHPELSNLQLVEPFCRLEYMISPAPMIADTMPAMAYFIWPVMKLPGKTLMPCKNHTMPVRISKTPTIIRITFIPGLLERLFQSFFLYCFVLIELPFFSSSCCALNVTPTIDRCFDHCSSMYTFLPFWRTNGPGPIYTHPWRELVEGRPL
jgi:hypothetical protein